MVRYRSAMNLYPISRKKRTALLFARTYNSKRFGLNVINEICHCFYTRLISIYIWTYLNSSSKLHWKFVDMAFCSSWSLKFYTSFVLLTFLDLNTLNYSLSNYFFPYNVCTKTISHSLFIILIGNCRNNKTLQEI